jgi:hypothetical protein
MIVDPNVAATIIGVSNINPIQLWPPDRPTFNQTKIKLVPTKKYFQKFDFLETLYNRLDIAFNEGHVEDWDASRTYSIGDKVYFPDSGTEPPSRSVWISNSDNNINHNPNPTNTEVPHTSPYWNYGANNLPALGNPLIFNGAASYDIGDRVIDYSGAGTFYRVFQSLTNGNVGHSPRFNLGTYWDDVSEAAGTEVFLRIYSNTVLIASMPFFNVRSGSTHQYINWLWSVFPEVKDAIVTLDIYDPVSELVLAVSDCLRIVSFDAKPSLTIKYTNSDDFAGIAFEVLNQEFYIHLNAVFYEESHPVDSEDYNLSTGIIVSLRKQMLTKRLLNIIEPMPEFMHKKIEQILMCDYIEIDGTAWKKQGDEYQRAVPEASLLTMSRVLLTQANSVLVNISKGDILSGLGVFSEEFSEQFS